MNNKECHICHQPFFGASWQYMKEHKSACKYRRAELSEANSRFKKLRFLLSFFGVPFQEKTHPSLKWNGANLEVFGHTDEMEALPWLTLNLNYYAHELAHWLLATEEEKLRADFGMGVGDDKDELLVLFLERHIHTFLDATRPLPVTNLGTIQLTDYE